MCNNFDRIFIKSSELDGMFLKLLILNVSNTESHTVKCISILLLVLTSTHKSQNLLTFIALESANFVAWMCQHSLPKNLSTFIASECANVVPEFSTFFVTNCVEFHRIRACQHWLPQDLPTLLALKVINIQCLRFCLHCSLHNFSTLSAL